MATDNTATPSPEVTAPRMGLLERVKASIQQKLRLGARVVRDGQTLADLSPAAAVEAVAGSGARAATLPAATARPPILKPVRIVMPHRAALPISSVGTGIHRTLPREAVSPPRQSASPAAPVMPPTGPPMPPAMEARASKIKALVLRLDEPGLRPVERGRIANELQAARDEFEGFGYLSLSEARALMDHPATSPADRFRLAARVNFLS